MSSNHLLYLCLYLYFIYATGLFIDLHGQSHDSNRIQIGYLTPNSALLLRDVELNCAVMPVISTQSSMTTLPNNPQILYSNRHSLYHLLQSHIIPITFSELIRGDSSLGSIFEQHGVYFILNNCGT